MPMSTAESSNTVMATVFSERRSDLTITARETRADGVVALTLADPSGAQLPGWTPGAHIDVLLADDLVRQYSFAARRGISTGGGSVSCSTRTAAVAPDVCTRR